MFESRKERCGEGEILKEKNRNGEEKRSLRDAFYTTLLKQP